MSYGSSRSGLRGKHTHCLATWTDFDVKDSGGPAVSEYIDTVVELEKGSDDGSWKDEDDLSDEIKKVEETQQ